jgi:hypothetical protein
VTQMQVQNKNKSFFKVQEHHLIWTYERYEYLMSDLRTLDALRVEVIEPGTPNLDNGPDYLNALLKIDAVLMRGDIEFHVDWRDWYRHGHDKDRRYERVILHVLWKNVSNAPEDLKKRFHHMAISQNLNRSFQKWRDFMINLASHSQISDLKAKLFTITDNSLQELAWNRFLRKCNEIKSRAKNYNWEDVLYIGLAQSLGYSKNSLPFTQLIEQVPPSTLLKIIPPLQRSSLFFFVTLSWHAGLFDRPIQSVKETKHSTYEKMIYHIRQQFQDLFPTQRQQLVNWNFSRVRPTNNPYVRLAGFAQIFFNFQCFSLFKQLFGIISSRPSVEKLLPQFEKSICTPFSFGLKKFLTTGLGFNFPLQRTMGRERCALFALNILLPLFYVWAQKNGNTGFLFYLEDIYFNFPKVDNNSALQRISLKIEPKVRNKAYVQQGIMEYSLKNPL